MKILIYTFLASGKLSYKTLKHFEEFDIDKFFISSAKSQQNLLDSIQNYDLVLGIADHNKRVINSRIDPLYINKYGKNKILSNSDNFYKSNISVEKLNLRNFYILSSFTNGPCNRSGYLIMNKISIANLHTKYCFAHLAPKNIDNDLKLLIQESINYTKAI